MGRISSVSGILEEMLTVSCDQIPRRTLFRSRPFWGNGGIGGRRNGERDIYKYLYVEWGEGERERERERERAHGRGRGGGVYVGRREGLSEATLGPHHSSPGWRG